MMDSTIDLLIRIKNGYMSKRSQVAGIYSKMNEHVLAILKEEGYIKSFTVTQDGAKKKLDIELLYVDNEPALTDIKVMSRPGRRMYSEYKRIKPILGGMGISIYSTPKGIMTGKKALENNTGGEFLFELW